MATYVDALAAALLYAHGGGCSEQSGGSALARRLPMGRYYRDVRSGPIHPISGYDALEVIGKHAFGIPRDTEPRWV
jgi:alkylation response protein AidB-like acyl-CoA dehydrogenase